MSRVIKRGKRKAPAVEPDEPRTAPDVTAHLWPLTSKKRLPTDPAARVLIRAGDKLHQLGLRVLLVANPDGSRVLNVWPARKGRKP